MVVDQLEIQIKSQATAAIAELNRLEAKLSGIKTAMIGTTAAGNAPIISNKSMAQTQAGTKSLLASLSKITFAFFALRRIGCR